MSPWVHLSTIWPTVPAPDDGWWWAWIRRCNNWQGKQKYSEKTSSCATLSTTNPTWPDQGRRGHWILYCHTRDLTEHAEHMFHMVVYSRYSTPSDMFWTKCRSKTRSTRKLYRVCTISYISAMFSSSLSSSPFPGPPILYHHHQGLGISFCFFRLIYHNFWP
jgi:hypothetical protein